jgi:hypothetical protein
MGRQPTLHRQIHWQQWSEAKAWKARVESAESRERLAQCAQSKGVSAQRVEYWKQRLGETATTALVAVPLTTGQAQTDVASDEVTDAFARSWTYRI